MSSQRSQLTMWRKDEFERLVAWMEDNQEAIRGKQITWYKQVKEQVFAYEDHITVKKISDKMANAKRAWKEAKAILERSGWGMRPEDNEQSVNDILERKCTLFWRLDAIWGSQRNSNTIVRVESPGHDTPGYTPSPALEQSPSPQISRSPTPEPSAATPHHAPKLSKRDKSGTMQQIKRMLDEKQHQKEIQEAKKLKADIEWRRERLAAKLDLQREQMQERLASQKEIAKMQADAQVKQVERFARIMELMMQGFLGATGSTAPTAVNLAAAAPEPELTSGSDYDSAC
ncbi:hypothetical protein BDZ91DRAFT_736061 [Kalaharituber pfeilii]|nr:hypothetical protein BDZ91DRAFT_736061 [Kalaharituber pfeilii]